MRIISRILGHLYFIYGILLFVATMLVVVIPIWLTTLLAEPSRAKVLHKIFKIWMGFFMPVAGCPVFRKGKEHFKKGENYVVVTNHNSFVDVPVSSPWIPGPNKTLAKVEVSKIPVFGIIYTAGSILVNRANDKSRRQSFIEMEKTLNMGINLCLYPEGTRNKSELPIQRFYDGAFTIAIKTQRPIIPGIIFNTKKILPSDNKLWARPTPIRFHFLTPIETKGLTLEDTASLKQRVHNIMTEYYVANK